jgi:hypothetical protein
MSMSMLARLQETAPQEKPTVPAQVSISADGLSITLTIPSRVSAAKFRTGESKAEGKSGAVYLAITVPEITLMATEDGQEIPVRIRSGVFNAFVAKR